MMQYMLDLALSDFVCSMCSRTASCSTLAEGVSLVGNIVRSDSIMSGAPMDLAAMIAATWIDLINPKPGPHLIEYQKNLKP